MVIIKFKRCKDISELEKIAGRLGLKELLADSASGRRSWSGIALDDIKGSEYGDYNRTLNVIYTPDNKQYPVILQFPATKKHDDADVIRVVKQYLDICKPPGLSGFDDEPYDMEDYN